MSAPTTTISAARSPSAAPRLGWLAALKACALLWIILNHISEQLFGGPWIANPTSDWPPLADRVAQLAPLPLPGLGGLLANALRYVGWFGDQGVALFLIASGFGLAWGLLARGTPERLALRPFLLRRVWRLYPLWIAVHLVFLAVWFATGWGLAATPQTLLSMAGLRLTPGMLYYFAPAWWFFGLLLQLYLIFPLLWRGLKRLGPLRLLLICAVVGCASRALGLLILSGPELDWWSRGGFFLTRLPEFALGIALAGWLFADGPAWDRRLRAPASLVAALVLYLAGQLLSLTLLGMAVAPLLLGAGLFVPLYALFHTLSGAPALLKRPVLWLGDHSYSVFLVHHPLVLLLVPTAGLSVSVGLRALAAIGLSIAAGWALEQATDRFQLWVTGARQRHGTRWLLGRAAALAGVLLALLLGADAAVRSWAPQEALGWGERPSLQPSAAFGWQLRPSQVTHLRWESYDYTVSANSLGFPGPDLAPAKPAGVRRVLVTGDAFSSAEGVDSAQSWPRLLEQQLQPRGAWQVQNFAVTGYGPNQEAAVIAAYAPVYRPDLIIVQAFVNDGEDVLTTDDAFRASIGFRQPDPDSLLGRLLVPHLRQYLRLHLFQPLAARLRGQPSPPIGFFWGGFGWLARGSPALSADAQRAITDRYRAIRATADQIGARVIVVLAPAPAQVCRPDQLPYYPSKTDLADQQRFDAEGPQRLFAAVTAQVGVSLLDLRPALQAAAGGCPYQPHNLHWLPSGHAAVADYLATVVK